MVGTLGMLLLHPHRHHPNPWIGEHSFRCACEPSLPQFRATERAEAEHQWVRMSSTTLANTSYHRTINRQPLGLAIPTGKTFVRGKKR